MRCFVIKICMMEDFVLTLGMDGSNLVADRTVCSYMKA